MHRATREKNTTYLNKLGNRPQNSPVQRGTHQHYLSEKIEQITILFLPDIRQGRCISPSEAGEKSAHQTPDNRQRYLPEKTTDMTEKLHGEKREEKRKKVR